MSKLFVRPAGLLLALMCFTLPFLAVSCDTPVGGVSAEYAGVDFVFGGEPSLTGSAADEATSGEEGGDESATDEDGRVDPQPLAVLAFVSIIGGLVLSVLPRLRAHTLANLGAGVTMSLLLVANQIVLHDAAVNELAESDEIFAARAAEMVGTRYGFWLTLMLLLAVVGYSVVELLRERGRFPRAGALSGGYPPPPPPPRGGAPAGPGGPGSRPPSGGG
ncbi:MAG TPA: hypothetical protein VFU43_30305 [Streptosporangiaceae bacterium]|nr:hypothetical protein [Streptosporangiaceae bacterium]